MKRLKVVYSFCLFIMVLSCKNNRDVVIGSWSDDFSMSHSSITISPNGEFEYFSSGCLGKSYTKGTWTLKDTILTLNSYAEYKTKNEYVQDSIRKNYREPVLHKKDSLNTETIEYLNTINLLISLEKEKSIHYSYFSNRSYIISRKILKSNSLIPIHSDGIIRPEFAYLKKSDG